MSSHREFSAWDLLAPWRNICSLKWFPTFFLPKRSSSFTSLLFGGHMWWAFFSLMSVGWWFKKLLREILELFHFFLFFFFFFFFWRSYCFVWVTFIEQAGKQRPHLSSAKGSIYSISTVTDKSIMHYIWPLLTLHCLHNKKLIIADLNQNAWPVQAFFISVHLYMLTVQIHYLTFSYTSNATKYEINCDHWLHLAKDENTCCGTSSVGHHMHHHFI